jgi:hypothetical protein
MAPGGEREGIRHVVLVRASRRLESADDAAVDQNLEILPAVVVRPALGGGKVDLIRAGVGGGDGEALGDGAGPLEEGDLASLRGGGVPLPFRFSVPDTFLATLRFLIIFKIVSYYLKILYGNGGWHLIFDQQVHVLRLVRAIGTRAGGGNLRARVGRRHGGGGVAEHGFATDRPIEAKGFRS